MVATVFPAGPAPLATVPGSVPLQAGELPITDAQLQRLAQECAREIYPLGDILRAFKIDPIYFGANIIEHPRFVRYYSEATALWASAGNVQERIALKAAVILEEALPSIDALLHDTREGIMGKAKLVEWLSGVSGISGRKDGQPQPGDRVSITINMGAGHQVQIEKEIPAQVKTIEGDAVTVVE